MRTTTVILSIVLVVCGAIAWAALQPPPARPKVSIALLGYTNDSAGTRLAMIAVTNLGVEPIYVYRPCIAIPSPTEPRGFDYYFQGNTNQWYRFHTTLGRGASESFMILPPDQPSWRISFLAYNDLGMAQVIKRIFTRIRYMPSEIESDWWENNIPTADSARAPK